MPTSRFSLFSHFATTKFVLSLIDLNANSCQKVVDAIKEAIDHLPAQEHYDLKEKAWETLERIRRGEHQTSVRPRFVRLTNPKFIFS